MKKLISVCLCLLIVVLPLISVSAYAKEISGNDSYSEGADPAGGDAVVSETQTSSTEAPTTSFEPETVEQFEYDNDLENELRPEEIHLDPSDKMALLNSAELHPLKTGYEPLDSLVESTLSRILTDDMTTFDKVRTIYSFIMNDSVYLNENQTTADLYSTIRRTVPYKSLRDRNIVCEAYGFLVERLGVCDHFSSAFVVLTRALGLESYIIICSNSTFGAGDHYGTMIRLNGKLYLFDPVIDNVMSYEGEVEDSDYFCTAVMNTPSREYCSTEELIQDFENFETSDSLRPIPSETIPGETVGDVHYTFGSYPQSRVTDEELLSALNNLLDEDNMISYSYSIGTGEIGSQTKSDYMKYADVTYEGEKYRAVKFDYFRPKYTYYSFELQNSLQYRTKHQLQTVYWFKYEPIEWRLTDGDNLLLADLALDAQPYNEDLFYVEGGKEIDGKVYYAFSDADCTIPANNWEYSSIRRWLNEDFYNTAFSDEEKRLIEDSVISNYGSLDKYSFDSTTDKVFLLSQNEVVNSSYFLAESRAARKCENTDYAKAQGVTSKQAGFAHYSSWLLRSAGYHSEDVCVVADTGLSHNHMKTAATMNGIRPAIRANVVSAWANAEPAKPDKVTAYASATGEITVKASVSNGASGYRFYCFSDDTGVPEKVITSESPLTVISDLTPGVSYTIRVASYTVSDVQILESELSEPIEVMCRMIVDPPERISAVSEKTGTVTLEYSQVPDAVEYRVYKYISSFDLELCGVSDSTVCVVEDLIPMSNYRFRVSAVSPDGCESFLSHASATCYCISYPLPPENTSAVASSTGCLTLSWDPVEEADEYHLYRFAGNGAYTEIAVTDQTEYTVSGLVLGITYYFIVKSATADGEHISANASIIGQCLSIPPAPMYAYAQPVKTGQLMLHWSPSEDAVRYHVLRFDGNGEYNEIAVTEATEYLVDGLATDTSYYFQITAEAENGIDISAPVSLNGRCLSIPAVPKNAVATASATGELTLTWDKSDDAVCYHVYRFAGNGIYNEIAVTEDTSYTVTGLSVGTEYYFQITAEAENGVDISAPASVHELCQSIPAKVENLTADPSATGKVTLSWDQSAGAVRYHVFRYGVNSTYNEIAVIEDTTYTVSGLSPGVEYYLYVTAEADNGDLSSPSSVRVRCRSIPGIPQNLTAQTSSKPFCVSLSWDPVEDATGYEIYRFLGSDIGYDVIGQSDTPSFEATALRAGVSFSFKVAAVKDDGAVRHVSGLSDSAAASTNKIDAPQNFTAVASESSEITLSWDRCIGADCYNVYCYDKTLSAYTVIGSTTEASFTVSDLTPSTSYSFRVEPVAVFGDVSLPGTRSAAVACRAVGGPDAPSNVTAEAVDLNSATLSWSAVKNASFYEIYLKTVDEDHFTLYASTEACSYSANHLPSAASYQIKVAAVTLKDQSRFTGAFSDEVSLTLPGAGYYILGDADNDGVVTVLDATSIQKKLASLPVRSTFYEPAAYVDGLEQLHILQATYIQKWLASLPVSYPIGSRLSR